MDSRLCLVLLVASFSCILPSTYSQTVPVLSWSTNIISRPKSTSGFNTFVDTVESNDILANYLEENFKVPIVAFVQNELDVEQFRTNNAPYVSTLFENSDYNPLFFTNAKIPVEFYSNFKTKFSEDSLKDNKILIDLPGENLKENDDVIKSYMERFNNSGPIVFMLTGKSNSFLNNIRSTRSTKDTSNVLQYPQKEPCLYFYSTKATLIKQISDKESKSLDFAGSSITIKGGECGKVEFKDKPNEIFNASKLALKMVNSSDTIVVNFEFSTSTNLPWSIKSIEIEENGKKNFKNVNYNLSTEYGFSYSCQKAVFKLVSLDKDFTGGELVFNEFQLQPFVLKKSLYKFEDSFDCAVWFTIPLFSSLLVCLLLITILYFGVMALMSISTPDRFENPKGKSLIITNFEE